MSKRTHRMICLFYIALLLLTGIYMDTIPEEALSVCSQTGKTTAILAPLHSDINCATICPKEFPNILDMKLQSRGKFQEQHREVNECLYLSCFGSGSLFHGKSYRYHAAASLFFHSQNDLVTEYMHQSDGKKRV